MAFAAVPNYLGDDFRRAAPGHRFYLYFPVWSQGRNGGLTINSEDKKKAVKNVLPLNPGDQKAMTALAERQQHMASDRIWQLPTKTIAPMTTGLGMEHPLENGFAFLNPYGLPYLPGSSIKGVLRQAARELIEDEDEETGWTNDLINTLFGPESQDENDARRGALIFWDALPVLPGDRLMTEVMTPHQTQYYEGKEAPHDSGQPNPILFLAIPPDSRLNFFVDCERRLLSEDMDDAAWQQPLREAFEYACDWLGFGAKTAVGYGHLKIDNDLLAQQAEEQVARAAEAQKQAEIAEKTANLDDDAANLVQRRENSEGWANNGVFLDQMEAWLASLEAEQLSPAAWDIVVEELRDKNRFKGDILANPDAMGGKKGNKPKYKPRQIKLAKALLARKPKDEK